MVSPEAEDLSNEEQVRFWNGPTGQMWVTVDEENERHLSPFGDVALQVASATTGEKVLDVGCGCGATSLDLAKSVGETGEVAGIDVSGVMLQRAIERSREANQSNVSFLQLDAQSAKLGSQHRDLVFSRFGVMFFADPVAAFANMHSTLRPGGRIVFVCWQVPKANPWMSLPNRAALDFFGLTPPPHDAPGPFSLADPDQIRRILSGSGSSNIEIEGVSRQIRLAVGQGVDRWVHERLQMGLVGDLYRAADDATRTRARHLLAATVQPYEVDDGLEMNGAAWVVSAR